MTALAWLNDLVQWFARWVPRLVLIEPTHRGVLFGPRGGARGVGPGLVLFWPITHALTQVSVATQSLQLSSQVLPLPEVSGALLPRVLLCGAAIQFRVTDPVAFAVRALHSHALVDNRTSGAIARHFEAHGSNRAAWMGAVQEDLAVELQPYGVVVERLDITQNGTGIALKNVADWNYQDAVGGKRPE